MKKYKFKLDGLLKVREFKEKKIKIELGKIVKAMEEIKNEIKKLNNDIDEGYDAQEKLAGAKIPVGHIQFFPFFWEGIREDIVVKTNLLNAYKKKYDEMVIELKKAMGDVKVIENIKEKDFAKYRNDLAKEEIETNEEMMMMRTKRKSDEN